VINNQACEVSLELEQPIEIRGEGGQPILAKTVHFKKPTRTSGPIFQRIASMITRAMMGSMALVESVTSKEEIAKAKERAERLNQTKSKEGVITSLENITEEELDSEVEGMIAMFSTLDVDFEKLQQLFDRMLLSGSRSTICTIGGMPLTDGMLDKLDYQDYLKMMAVYVSFFGKPAKSGTKKESEMPSESALSVTEL
jgi:hypothetical protein